MVAVLGVGLNIREGGACWRFNLVSCDIFFFPWYFFLVMFLLDLFKK
jgi:hypothetical protein